MTYLVDYLKEDGQEDIMEVNAYSTEQAYFLAKGCLPSDSFVVGIELVCQKACGL